MANALQTLDISAIPLNSLYIDGTWQKPKTDATIDVISPRTGQPVASAVDAGKLDVEMAVAAARKAFEDGNWSGLSIKERADWLTRLNDKIQKRSDDLATAWSMQIGIAPTLSTMITPFFIGAIAPYVALADEFAIEQERPTAGDVDGFLVYEPVGVVAAIAPWNVPASAMLNKVAPALLAGCTVIMKPAPETPIEAYIIAQCADEIGLPAGVLNLLAAGREGSDHLVRQPDVDKVSFTGSVATGRHIAQICGERLARCTLELGGKSAAIVLDDYDLESAANVLVESICGLSGQNCAALSRVIVSRARHDELIGYLKAACEAVEIGKDDPGALGPIATERQLERIEAYIAKGIDQGAKLVTGGKRPTYIKQGYFIEPTIFSNVDNSMVIAQEEIFGPVICVIPSDDVDDAIRIANDSNFGLAGAVFTNNRAQAKYVARRVRTGTMAQNAPLADFSIGFGGFKQSGIGREGGIQGLMGFLEPKTMILQQA